MRKPALIAATLALAVVPAMTAVAPAHAAPRALPVAAAEELSIVEMVLQCFPEGMANAGRAILAGQLDQVFVLFGEALKLTPSQLTDIMTKLQAVLGQLTGGLPVPAPTETTPPAAAPTEAPSTTSVQNKKVAWTLESLLKDSDGKKSGPVAANILLNSVLAAR